MSSSLCLHFEMREFAYFTLCKPPRNVTGAQYLTAFIKHKHWIKDKTYPIQTNSVSFHQPNIAHVCLVLKKWVPLLLFEVRWGQKFGKCIVFFFR